MRLWAEERRGGTIELLLTLPITLAQAVFSKFLAAWVFTAIALALTPMWLTVNYLGNPDNGVIVAGYLGSLPRLVLSLRSACPSALREIRSLCSDCGGLFGVRSQRISSGAPILQWMGT